MCLGRFHACDCGQRNWLPALAAGILIKEWDTDLEDARLLKAVALDKTGTITEGKPKLVQWRFRGAG